MSTLNRRAWRIIAVTMLIKMVASLAFLPDPSLAQLRPLDNIPYGILWQWTNPLYWVSWEPQLMVLLDVVPTVINYKMLSRNMFLAWTFTDFHWFMGFFANSSVTWFSPYPFIGPLWTALQKLPVGYWPVLDNRHVECALYCSAIASQVSSGHWWRWGNAVTYAIITAWTIIPTSLWFWNRHKLKSASLCIKT